MKKWVWMAVILLMACTGSITPLRVSAQQEEAQQLLLNVEKLNQFRQILQQMYKTYTILRDGYTKIRDITSGNYKLHQVFLDGLLAVSPGVRKYQRIADIIQYQLIILKEYKSAYATFKESGQFNEQEITYLFAVYKNLVNESVQQLDELVMVITDGKLRMSDSERMEAIDRIFISMQDKLTFLRDFNQQHTVLAIQRARDSNDINILRQLYDLK
jgi:hypothetical protein